MYFYSVTGQKLGTYSLGLFDPPPGQGTPSLTVTSLETRVWFGAKLVTLNGVPMTPDRLGSYGTYYPYGEDRGAGNPPADREKFATYTRDSVTGLDYAVNRYYYSVSGRFLSADPYVNSAGPTEPGSWNRYAYVGGDPIDFRDHLGLSFEGADDGDDDPLPSAGCWFNGVWIEGCDIAWPTHPNRVAAAKAQERYDRSITRIYRGKLDQRLENLGNCTKILGGRAPRL